MIFYFSAPPVAMPTPDYAHVMSLGYYKLHKEPQDWHTARVTCNQEGAHLVIINSQFEYSVIQMLFDRNPTLTSDWRNQFAFVGISDLQQEKHFVTIFGKYHRHRNIDYLYSLKQF